MEFQLPELGEGVYEAELVSWHVQPGDTVEAGQNLVEVRRWIRSSPEDIEYLIKAMQACDNEIWTRIYHADGSPANAPEAVQPPDPDVAAEAESLGAGAGIRDEERAGDRSDRFWHHVRVQERELIVRVDRRAMHFDEHLPRQRPRKGKLLQGQ